MAAPWLKFYPTDWQSDPALRMCSLAARGLWQEMLCIMHKAEPYGSLVVNGIAITPKQLAMLCGAPAREVEACLQEMEASAVFSRDENGTIYSRRMRRDFLKSERDRANGGKGGNPKIVDGVKGGVNPPSNPRGKKGVKAQSQKPDSDSEGPESTQPRSPEAAREAAPERLVSPEAIRIAEELAESVGITKENWPPGWCGAAMAIQKWLNDGCPGEVIKLAVTSSLKRKRDGPPDNFAYFAKPIAAAFADYQRPNPTVPPQVFEENMNGHAPRKRTVIDAADDLVDRVRALSRPRGTGG